MLDAPRELLARAALPLEPEKALLLRPPPPPWFETWRFPMRSPPPPPEPRLRFWDPVALAESPLLNWLPPKLPVFCRAAVCLWDMVLPRALPLYLLATFWFA